MIPGYVVEDFSGAAERFQAAMTEGLGYPIGPVLVLPSNTMPGAVAFRFPAAQVPRTVEVGRLMWRARSLIGVWQPVCEECFATAYAETRLLSEPCEHVDHVDHVPPPE